MHQANLAVTRDRELASWRYSFFNLAFGAIKQSLYLVRIEADFVRAVGKKVRCGHQRSPWFAAKLRAELLTRIIAAAPLKIQTGGVLLSLAAMSAKVWRLKQFTLTLEFSCLNLNRWARGLERQLHRHTTRQTRAHRSDFVTRAAPLAGHYTMRRLIAAMVHIAALARIQHRLNFAAFVAPDDHPNLAAGIGSIRKETHLTRPNRRGGDFDGIQALKRSEFHPRRPHPDTDCA